MIQLGPPPPKGTTPPTGTKPAAAAPPPVIRKRRGGARGPVFIASNLVVLGWLLVTVALLIAHDVIDHPIWLAVHALLLGAATNAIIIWSGHFTTTLCRVPDQPEWHLAAKVAVLNVAVIAALTGVWINAETITGVAGAVVAIVAVVHGAELIAMKKKALSARFDYLVDFYLAAIVALLIGALAGASMAFGVHHWYARLWTTHVHVMLYGWIGLTVIGTLFTLWPTTMREKITPRSYSLAHRTLPTMAVGLGLAVIGLLMDSVWLTAVAFAVYLAGVVITVVALRPTRQPNGPAAWMLAAATVWLGVAVLIEIIGLIATRSAGYLPNLIETTVMPLLAVGFVAQVLMGALTEMVPVLTAHGPPQRKAVIAYLARGWQARLLALNIAVPLVAGHWWFPVQLIGWALAAIGVGSFLWLALALIIPVLVRGEINAEAVEKSRSWPMTGAVATAAAASVVLATTLGGSLPQHAGVKIAADAKTVDVGLKDMRFSPAVVSVPAGTHLVLRVTNDEALPHDLRVDTGQHTPRLGLGQTAVVDLGVVDTDHDVWCDVPGHRAAGMTMEIRAIGGKPRAHQHGDDMNMDHGPAVTPLNLTGDPSPGWQPYNPELALVGPEKLHRVELRALDRELEVAPGKKETRWTWGGTEPGPILHGRVGDQFELTLINDTSMGHGLDFHAGALAPDQPMRTIAPGEKLVYKFTARRAGAWLYHCSTKPMSLHIANGMYGAVIIDPPGLPAVDHEYALVGAQLFTGDPGSEQKVTAIRANQPDGWMFNGMADQYEHAPLTVRAGERVRVWVINAGPGETVAFHVVGTQFDTVYKEGAWLLQSGGPGGSGGSQALDLAPAQGGFVEMTFPEPGHYMIMDHDLRHAENGARGMFEVTG
ncbi:multicopper oxidase domain-containing protein [Mycobacterium sp. M1]|uniref:Copper-containing nitrite reductase n=1 Tax=Mycolicibacter acidiphilus TaxID=2835306 RepID=A0ABS5RGP7_9MYCO|nr:multicopper oxidase domain-containing protein [Mycolicibacter acidiphilus]MBS9533450.1 multicopper oxidase domain-containing protein [Mycolicibacter acidiphilus]